MPKSPSLEALLERQKESEKQGLESLFGRSKRSQQRNESLDFLKNLASAGIPLENLSRITSEGDVSLQSPSATQIFVDLISKSVPSVTERTAGFERGGTLGPRGELQSIPPGVNIQEAGIPPEFMVGADRIRKEAERSRSSEMLKILTDLNVIKQPSGQQTQQETPQQASLVFERFATQGAFKSRQELIESIKSEGYDPNDPAFQRALSMVR